MKNAASDVEGMGTAPQRPDRTAIGWRQRRKMRLGVEHDACGLIPVSREICAFQSSTGDGPW